MTPHVLKPRTIALLLVAAWLLTTASLAMERVLKFQIVGLLPAYARTARLTFTPKPTDGGRLWSAVEILNDTRVSRAGMPTQTAPAALDDSSRERLRAFVAATPDPGYAEWFKQRVGWQLTDAYAAAVGNAADELIRRGHGQLAAGHAPDAMLFHAAAITLLSEEQASGAAAMIVSGAQRLPKAYAGLARAAEAKGFAEWSTRLNAQAAVGDRLYAAWRKSSEGPPCLLPNTGAGTPIPNRHRLAMIALCQTVILLASTLVLAGLVATSLITCAIAWLFRSPRGGSQTAVAADLPHTTVLKAATLAVTPTAVACSVVAALSGPDWSWLFSIRLIGAIWTLVVLGTFLAIWFASHRLVAVEGETDAERRAFLRRALLLLGLLAFAILIAILVPLRNEHEWSPPTWLNRTVLLARLWLAVTIGFIGLTGLWRFLRRRPNHGGLFGRRRRATLAAATIGLFAHAIALPVATWNNDRTYAAYHRHASSAREREAATRLGTDWETRYPNPYRELLTPLREGRAANR